jgi:hypothetical protein
VLTVLATAVGWLVVHHLTVTRDREARVSASQAADRVRRLEILLKEAEAQISQFYGPVHGLIHQIWATWDVKQRFKGVLAPDAYAQIEQYLGERYFGAYHERIRALMRDNMHLIEGAMMPDSFYNYIEHSMMEHIQIGLWTERQVDTSAVAGISWDNAFAEDVERGLRDAIRRHDEIVEELRRDPASLVPR